MLSSQGQLAPSPAISRPSWISLGICTSPPAVVASEAQRKYIYKVGVQNCKRAAVSFSAIELEIETGGGAFNFEAGVGL